MENTATSAHITPSHTDTPTCVCTPSHIHPHPGEREKRAEKEEKSLKPCLFLAANQVARLEHPSFAYSGTYSYNNSILSSS
jgi:hypothetical protein